MSTLLTLVTCSYIHKLSFFTYYVQLNIVQKALMASLLLTIFLWSMATHLFLEYSLNNKIPESRSMVAHSLSLNMFFVPEDAIENFSAY